MKYSYFFLLIGFMGTMARCQDNDKMLYPNNAILFSQDFLLAIKTEQPYEAYRDTLAQIDLTRLKEELDQPEKKLAFWINTYNSLVQAKIRDDQKAFKDQDQFFRTADQNIGGIMLSLDDIESGILRRKKRSHDKMFFHEFQVNAVDPRIHFTLNCGATSCPPVAYYSPDKLEANLSAAEQSFVTQTSTYDSNSNTLTLSELFEWYEEDFGGKSGVIEMLQRLKIVPESASPTIKYDPYDWHLDIENFEE